MIKTRLPLTVFFAAALHLGCAAWCDIVFVLDKKAAFGNGHIAVMVGDEQRGWHYVSINGTAGMPKPWGFNALADRDILITDTSGTAVGNLRQAIRRADIVNGSKRHRYAVFRRIRASADEDSAVLNAAIQAASGYLYGIAGPGQSCIDVAQTAFSALVRLRQLDQNGSVPGQTDLGRCMFVNAPNNLTYCNFSKSIFNNFVVLQSNESFDDLDSSEHMHCFILYYIKQLQKLFELIFELQIHVYLICFEISPK